MYRRFRRKAGRPLGVQTLELLLVTPVIVIMLIAIMEFGTLHIVQSAVTNAANEGARRAGQGADMDDIVAAVQEVVALNKITISAAANAGTDVVLERGSLPAAHYNSNPGFTTVTPTPATVDPNEVRVTVFVGLDNTPVINVLSSFGFPFPKYNMFLLFIGPLVALGLWLLTNKTKIGKIARAAAVDREMVGAMGINVSWIFSAVFVIGCYLAGLGGALVAPMQNITQGMDHAIIIEAFLIVIIGGLGNIWGAMLGAVIFGLTDAIGILVWPQFAIVFPYVAVVIVLLLRPKGLLKSTW